MKPIVLYSRVSTTDQNFESQIEDLKKWCINNNFKVVESFGEKVSGYSQDVERIEYDKMKAFVLDKGIKDVAIWEISRLSRSMLKTINEIDFFTKNRINLHFKKEGIETLSDNVTNQLIITLLSSMAQMERDTFIERGSRGRMSAVMKGRMIGYSTPPYGYTSDENGIIMVEPDEAKTIKLVYELINKGATLRSVAKHLTSLGIPTRRALQGKVRTLKSGEKIEIVWKPVVISRLIRKPIYKGVRLYKGVSISYPSIVSEEVWELAQKRFDDKIGYLNRSKFQYLFKSKIRCSSCGRLFSTYHNKKDGNCYYMCTGITDLGHKCVNGKYINSKMIDENLYKSLFNFRYIKEVLLRNDSGVVSNEEKLKQIEFYENEITKLESQSKRFKKLYTDGYSTYDEFTKETATLTNNTQDYRNNINLLRNEIEINDTIDIDKILNTYKNEKEYEIKRDFINKYVNNIVLHQVDLANVNWKNPLQKNEKIIYVEIFVFNYIVPIKVLLTPYSKNVIISKSLQYLGDMNMVVDIEKSVDKK